MRAGRPWCVAMTKQRDALTFENALARIAGRIGWGEVARICKVKERAARNWSDPDTSSAVRLEQALALDLAFLAAGGKGPPLLYCYADRLEIALLDVAVDRHELVAGVAVAARENGEALAASLAAARPGASRADFAIAEREIEEAITAKKTILTSIRALARALTRRRGDDDLNAEVDDCERARGLEVPPPVVSA